MASDVLVSVPSTAPRLRVVYRESGGQVHLDWPFGRIQEALADLDGMLWIDIEDRNSAPTEIEALFRETFARPGEMTWVNSNGR